MAILTLSRVFANGRLRTADEGVCVPADAVGREKISSACLFVWTMIGVLVVDEVVLVVDANLACAGTTQSVHALAEGRVDTGRHVELWMEVGSWGGGWDAAFDLLLRSTVMDRCHCWVIVSCDGLSKQCHGENDDGVTLSGVGSS